MFRARRWFPAGVLGLVVAAAAPVRALDFSIPGHIEVYQDVPGEGEEPLDEVVGMDRPGSEGYYLLYSRGSGISCLSKDRRVRLPVWSSGGPLTNPQPPVVSADSDAVYSDNRYYQGSSYNRDGFQVRRFRCEEPIQDAGGVSFVEPASIHLSYDPAFTDLEPVGSLIAWDRRVCVVMRDRIGCASLDDPQPTLRTLVSAQEVAAGIAHPPFYDVPRWDWSMGPQYTFQDLFPGTYDFDTQPWGFHQAQALPDGRIAVLLRSEFRGPLAARAAYLVLLDSTGRTERVLHGPSTEWEEPNDYLRQFLNTRHPLLQVQGMVFDREERVLWLWPWSDWDWAQQKGFRSTDEVFPGFSGTGVLAVRLDRPGIGYLPLSAALVDSPYERIRNDYRQANIVPSVLAFVPLDGARARIEISRPTQAGFVRWDPRSLDRDQDGLSATEEEALGSDDWTWDTDGDGLEDGTEAGLGLDPLRDEGTMADRAFDRGTAGFAQSPWFSAFRLPEARPEWSGQKRFAQNPGTRGPFCIDNRCFFPDGRTLVVQHEVATVSLDGRWAVHPGGALRTDLVSGATMPWLDPPFDWERTGLAWYVEDADSAYVVVAPGNQAFTEVVHIDGAGNRQVLLSLEPGIRESGYPKPHRGAEFLWPVGYHGESRRLIVAAQGAWDSWLLAVSADRPPTMLQRAQGMTRQNRHRDHGTLRTAWGPLLEGSFPNGWPFPEWIHANGQGDYLGDRWIYGPFLEDGFLGAAWDLLGAETLDQMLLVGGFGDVLLDANTGSELVTIPRRVEAGDVLALASLDGDGAMLFRVGPRGGLVSLWSAPRKGFAFQGMGVSPKGRLCLAGEPGDACPEGCVAEFSPSEETRIPDVLTALIGGRGYRDCAYENEDTLVLWRVFPDRPVEEASRLERWERQGGGFRLVEDRPGELSLQGFLDQSNPPELVPDGSTVRVRTDRGDEIRLENLSGSPLLARADEDLGFQGTLFQDATARPDGLVIAKVSMPGTTVYPGGNYLVAYHPGRDRFARVLRRGDSENVLAVARVPGGVARDPWTGLLLDEAGDAGEPETGESAPLGPPVPDFQGAGDVVGGASGCAAGPLSGGGVPPWWVLLPLVAFWRVRGRAGGSLR
ncbi:hypothetical protein KBD49_13440 [Myxococcota bacterium]|nr:hypothetical protein [Myxococcota bacterium]